MPNVRFRRQSFPIGKPAALLSFTDNVPVDQLLANIPFFAIGLTGFAVFTFFLLVRRSNILAVYLYGSILFAFIGSILDLASILSRVSDGSPNNPTLDLQAATGVAAAREICFGLSVGLRNIFFWGFVALPPRERPEPSDSDSVQSFQLSGQKEEWVYFQWLKALLKWGLLLVITGVPIFQIIWRLSAQTSGFFPIYLTSIILEIVASTGMILQMVLNSLVSAEASPGSFFRSYSAPIIALFITLGISVGGIVIINFSETTLGRFLQTIVLYILVVFVMVVAFRRLRQSREPRSTTEKNTQMAKDQMLPPRAEAARQLMDTARRQSATRLSSWMAVRHLSLTTPSIEDIPAPPRRRGAPSINSWKPLPAVRDSPRRSRSPSMVDMEFALNSPPVEGGLTPPVQATKPLEPKRDSTSVHVPSYYQNFAGGLPFARNGVDSPIYGLNGFVQPSDQPASRPASEGMSLEDLLAQQRELDNSIAALRLFSPRSSRYSVQPADRPPLESKSSSSLLKRSESTSARSEFSLSNFPAPPDATDSGTTPVTTSAPRSNPPLRSKSHLRQSTLSSRLSYMDVLLPPLALKDRLDSSGTRYDVTSFIGGFSGPTSSVILPPEGGRQDSTLLQVVYEEGSSVPLSSAANHPQASPRIGDGATSVNDESIMEEPSSAMLELTSPRQQSNLRPLLLGSGAPTPFVPHSQVPVGSRSRGLNSSRLRPMISGPRPLLLDGRGELGEFERPRRPPGRPVSR
ncbi:hypothetical protein BDV98DRAFT_559556 [Pterulicium gracile]|uniref:Uncharacterized protein n=1 Tax=Pterulicium gracile TaxID=1884261 RepID=A0A5C3R5W9_9AGAR|nr:hypothetical protein BDV98DRAFT_559556 [Pterula gracilis]